MASVLPDEMPWITYWLIQVPPDRFGAGMIGFKGLPDENGAVEIGYGIDSAYRNQGYMTEAVIGLVSWAFRDLRCKRIMAPDTERANPASNRELEKVGMRVFPEKPASLSWHLEKDWGECFDVQCGVFFVGFRRDLLHDSDTFHFWVWQRLDRHASAGLSDWCQSGFSTGCPHGHGDLGPMLVRDWRALQWKETLSLLLSPFRASPWESIY